MNAPAEPLTGFVRDADYRPPRNPAPATLEDWLLAVVSADPADLRMVTIHGLAACSGARIRCEVHAQTFTWQSLYRHLVETELAWRAAHTDDGPHAALHRPGDVFEEGDDESRPRTWTREQCRSCHTVIVWAQTSNKKWMPVDAKPSASGNIVLTEQADSNAPLAMIVYSEQEREQIPDSQLHVSHFATCPKADKHRRSR